MKKKLVKVISLLAFAMPTLLYAVPATQKPLRHRQPDGTFVSIYLHGDEQNHYITDTKGYPVEKSKDGFYCYIGADGLITDAVLTMQETASLKSKARGIGQSKPADVLKAYLKRRPSTNGRCYDKSRKTAALGKRKVPVLLVQFPDVSFTTGTKERFNDMMNKEGYDYDGATGSCVDYFRDNSGGQFQPEFDVLGPVTLDHESSYYGQNDTNGNESYLGYMIKEACKKLDNDVDFSQYDNDGDGELDYVYVYYAGKGEHDTGITSLIWPQSWYMNSTNAGKFEVDGVVVDKFATSNELQGSGKFVGIGIFVHEFSHVLGLPDLYATTYNQSAFTPGAWSVLANGPYNNNGRTPPHYSAYELSELGWLNLKELDKPDDVTLSPVSENQGYRITTDKDNEYYVFENRQKEGWDKYIPGHGMLVWHIDYNESRWTNNLVNTNASHQCVDIVEADGKLDEPTRAGDSFPGTSHVTSFTDDTTPSMISWSGSRLNKPITDISENSDGIVTFKVMGGHRNISAPADIQATVVKPTSFTLAWTPSDDCDYQTVSVYTKEDNGDKVYVDGYKEKQIDFKVGTLEVNGLEPSTRYYAVLSSLTQYEKKSAEEWSVTTNDPTFDMFKVENVEATAVTSNSFKANWQALEGAQSYELTVKKRTIDTTPCVDVCDFTGKALPEGWTGKMSSYFSANGYYGTSAPSVSLAAKDHFIETKEYGKVTSISLWMSTMSYSSFSSLRILGRIGAEWTELENIPMRQTSEGATTITLPKDGETLPNGINAVRFELASTGDKVGRLLLDDIKVNNTAADVDEIFADYDHKNIGNVASYTVEGLEANKLYLYTVRGVADDLKSIESDECLVQLGTTGIDRIKADNTLIVKDGVLTISAKPGSSVVVSTVDGIAVCSTTVSDSGSCSVAMSNGLYIIRIADKAYKVKI